ncbi:MFS transporter [Kitasatospora sp. MAP5-34]|uniref:MFS transporter n=1 Tax=Kitasatospora sp. MAP5-34 TaxID=3035102 RepID=UPI00247582A7|nr:MFS transporter [Kitasatospora sp. MAP5-34]MDH6579418.1 MFS family permease [Kitasatospora sp. MAP5-34]
MIAINPSRLLHPDPMVRRLAAITLVNTVGNGLMMTLAVLFFTRVLGFGVAQVGLGLTAAGLCGVLAGIPAGRAADRWGSKPVLVTLVSLEAVGCVGYVLVHRFAAFVLVACFVAAVDQGSTAVRSALYAEVLPADRRVAGRAYLRVVTNIGMGVGTVLAALVLQADTRSAYVAAILVDAVSFAVVALMFVTVPMAERAAAVVADASTVEPTAEAAAESGPVAAKGGNPALRNLPFLVVTALSAVLCLQFAVIEVGVPLWIAKHTAAPRVMIAGSLMVNIALVVALQVRATKGTEQPGVAARIFRRGGLLLTASCLVLGLAHGLPALPAALLVLAGVGFQGLGEVFSQAAGWALSYDLAGEGAHGAYQGVFGTGMSASMMFGPALITTVVIGNGFVGWAVLGAVFAACGLAMPPIVRWSRRRTARTAPVAASVTVPVA